jgi:hypothetical protein
MTHIAVNILWSRILYFIKNNFLSKVHSFLNEWTLRNFSPCTEDIYRVHTSSDKAFFKILKKPSIAEINATSYKSHGDIH